MTFPMSRGLLLRERVTAVVSARVEMTFPMSRGLLLVVELSGGVVEDDVGGNDLPDE